MLRLATALLPVVLVAACAGVPLREGGNSMDWGPYAYSMSPDERAQMSECTQYATWSYCIEQMLGPGF